MGGECLEVQCYERRACQSCQVKAKLQTNSPATLSNQQESWRPKLFSIRIRIESNGFMGILKQKPLRLNPAFPSAYLEGLICCNTFSIKSFSRLWLQFCDGIIKCNQIVTVGGRFIDGYTHLIGFCRHWLNLRNKIHLCLYISALRLFSFKRKVKNKAPQACV